MSARSFTRAFFKSVLLGALAAAAPMLVVTIGMALVSLPHGPMGDGNLLSSLWLAILPLVVSFPVVLLTSAVFGLPFTFILRRSGRESEKSYVLAGVIIGLLVPIVALLLMEAPAGYWIGILGAFGGGVTGRTWWVSTREPQPQKSDLNDPAEI